jgi:hypothetical protein
MARGTYDLEEVGRQGLNVFTPDLPLPRLALEQNAATEAGEVELDLAADKPDPF